MVGQSEPVIGYESIACIPHEDGWTRVDLFMRTLPGPDGRPVEPDPYLTQYGIGEILPTGDSDRPFLAVASKFRIVDEGNGVSWIHMDKEELGTFTTLELAKLAIDRLHRIRSGKWQPLGRHQNWNSAPDDN